MAITALPINNVTMTLLVDGPRLAVAHFYLQSDGVSGELNNTPVFDPAIDLVEPLAQQFDPSDGHKLPLTMTIMEVWYGLSWFDVTIAFESDVNSPRLVLTRDAHDHMDLREFGGIKDLYDSNSTGRVLFSTKDFAPAGSNGHVIIAFKKD